MVVLGRMALSKSSILVPATYEVETPKRGSITSKVLWAQVYGDSTETIWSPDFTLARIAAKIAAAPLLKTRASSASSSAAIFFLRNLRGIDSPTIEITLILIGQISLKILYPVCFKIAGLNDGRRNCIEIIVPVFAQFIDDIREIHEGQFRCKDAKRK
jgi:hypothetical protein